MMTTAAPCASPASSGVRTTSKQNGTSKLGEIERNHTRPVQPNLYRARPMIRSRSLAVLAVGCALLPGAVVMLSTPVLAQEVVQQLPNPATADLNDALRRLSRNPGNIRALLDAGNASLALGDTQAALGFFNRAQAARPEDEGVLTGLALVAVRRGEGAIAVQLFDNANAAGASLSRHAAERGLAYDLVGDNSRAQRFYRQALSREESDETIRRLALSYAISGDGAASEATLLPLLQRQDRSAFRSRAFALAILGQDDEAITIAEAMLPPRLSGRLAPYLRYMPRLTRAQQAAAANLGRFPAASEIGRDTPQILAMAAVNNEEQAAPPAMARADRLTPSGEPLGAPASGVVASGAVASEVVQAVPAQARPVQPVATQTQPSLAEAAAPSRAPEASGELPALASAAPVATTPPPAATAMLQPVSTPVASEPQAVVVAVLEEAAPMPEPMPEQAEEQLDLATAFADFTLPTSGLPVAPSEGAVDITAIEPAREAPPAPPAPPPPPAHPSRHWVQVATGQDLAAFRFDWRRIVRNAEGALAGREAYSARWNQTNRLVTGPFASAREANAFVTRLGEAGIDSFRFTSAEGEEVRRLD